MIWKRWDRESYSRSRPEEMCLPGALPNYNGTCSPLLYLTQAILLSDCQAGADLSCSSATYMKLRIKDSTYNPVSEICNPVSEIRVLAFHSSAVGKGRCWHWMERMFGTAVPCSASLPGWLVLHVEHMSLIRQQQRSLSLLHWKRTTSNLPSGSPTPELQGHADGSQRESNDGKNQGDVQHGSRSLCATAGLRCHKRNLNLTIKKMAGEREAPFICRVYFKSKEWDANTRYVTCNA